MSARAFADVRAADLARKWTERDRQAALCAHLKK
jgi:hypothetical protein